MHMQSLLDTLNDWLFLFLDMKCSLERYVIFGSDCDLDSFKIAESLKKKTLSTNDCYAFHLYSTLSLRHEEMKKHKANTRALQTPQRPCQSFTPHRALSGVGSSSRGRQKRENQIRYSRDSFLKPFDYIDFEVILKNVFVMPLRYSFQVLIPVYNQ